MMIGKRFLRVRTTTTFDAVKARPANEFNNVACAAR